MGDYGENYCTFIPAPLLDIKIKMDAELAALLSNAHRLLGQLEGMSGFLPNANAINTIMIQIEAQLSCQIDGIAVPLYNILDTSQKETEAINSIKSYISSMNTGLEKIKATQYSNKLLCEVHQKLKSDNNCENSGKFRTEHTFVGKVMIMTNDFHTYNPTSPAHILKAMHNLEQFIRRDDEIDILVKVALAHYQFETIHPFMVGNGFAGRILPYLMLADKKILTRPFICLSQYLNVNKVEYIDRMKALQRKCDYEQWVKFYVRVVIFAASNSLENIRKWLAVRNENLAMIEKSGKSIKAIWSFYDSVEQIPIFDINTISQTVGISYNTGNAAIKLLAGMGIVKQVNQTERYRSYACTSFLDCFTDKDVLLINKL